MDKFAQGISEAGDLLRQANHLVGVSFPMTKDKRILLSSLVKLRECVAKLVTAALRYESLCKRVKLYSDTGLNMREFEIKCAGLYGLENNDIVIIKNLFEVCRLHKESAMEFTRNTDVFIMSARMVPVKINHDMIKDFLAVAKKVFHGVNARIL